MRLIIIIIIVIFIHIQRRITANAVSESETPNVTDIFLERLFWSKFFAQRLTKTYKSYAKRCQNKFFGETSIRGILQNRRIKAPFNSRGSQTFFLNWQAIIGHWNAQNENALPSWKLEKSQDKKKFETVPPFQVKQSPNINDTWARSLVNWHGKKYVNGQLPGNGVTYFVLHSPVLFN